jgi:septal ring factor EnvC (AmiA/AmiB activator)
MDEIARRLISELDAARQERDRYLKERDQSWEETAGAMARAEEAEAMVRLQRDAAEELRQRAEQAEQERDRLRSAFMDVWDSSKHLGTDRVRELAALRAALGDA